MSHTLIPDPANEVATQTGAVVSKVVQRDDGLNVTVFGFDAGEQLTEHQAAKAAVVQVLSGRLRFTVDEEQLELGPGYWLHMAPGAPHSLIATALPDTRPVRDRSLFEPSAGTLRFGSRARMGDEWVTAVSGSPGIRCPVGGAVQLGLQVLWGAGGTRCDPLGSTEGEDTVRSSRRDSAAAREDGGNPERRREHERLGLDYSQRRQQEPLTNDGQQVSRR